MTSADMCTLHVVFPEPGFFATDPRFVIMLDGEPLHDGSFRTGASCSATVAPGSYELETQIYLTPSLPRRRRYALELTEPVEYTATLRYSRFWGNFTRKLSLQNA